MLSSLQKKMEKAQQREESELRESLGKAEQRAYQKLHQVMEYEQEVSAAPPGPVWRATWALYPPVCGVVCMCQEARGGA